MRARKRAQERSDEHARTRTSTPRGGAARSDYHRGVNVALGLGAWIVEEGNYKDFETGQRIEVAVEFQFEECARADASAGSLEWVEGCQHDVVGLVTFVSPSLWVIVAGVQMYCDRPPPTGVTVGSAVRGRAYLGIDPFAYFERYAHDAQVPPIIYAWCVAKIRRATRGGWRELQRTNASVDDDGNAAYVLECELLPAPPKRSTITGIPQR